MAFETVVYAEGEGSRMSCLDMMGVSVLACLLACIETVLVYYVIMAKKRRRMVCPVA